MGMTIPASTLTLTPGIRAPEVGRWLRAHLQFKRVVIHPDGRVGVYGARNRRVMVARLGDTLEVKGDVLRVIRGN